MDTDRHPERYLRRRVGHRPLQRVAAAAALLVEVAVIVLLVVIVVRRPLFALVLLVVAVLVLAASFVALTSVGHRRAAASAAALGLGALLVAGLLLLAPAEDEPVLAIPGVLAGVIVAALLQRYALRVPPPASPKLFQVRPGARRATERAVLLVNLRSGGGRAEAAGVATRAEALGVRTVVLEPDDDLAALARRAAAEGADALGMAGGDGSLGCVAEVAVHHDLPFVCVPAGTRNHFALDLGLDRDDPCQALSAFVTGEERRVDYATVNDRVFLNNVALGVYAAIVEQPSYRDAKVETALSLVPKLVAEGGPWFDLHLDVPGHGRLDSVALLMVVNNPYDLRAALGRRGSLDGGELGVLAVDPQHLGDLVQMTLLAATRRAERSSALWSWSVPELEVASGQGEMPAGVDGETVRLATPLRFASVAQGLRVLVPKGSRVGLREQRGDGARYSGLFEVAFNLSRPGDETAASDG